MLVNDDEMLANDREMSILSYTHFTIINEHFSSFSLKYTIIRSSDHHCEAAPTAFPCVVRPLHPLYLGCSATPSHLPWLFGHSTPFTLVVRPLHPLSLVLFGHSTPFPLCQGSSLVTPPPLPCVWGVVLLLHPFYLVSGE